MALNVDVDFPASPGASLALSSGLVVRRYEVREEIGHLFELTVEVLCTDPALDEKLFVGEHVVLKFGDEPFVTAMAGIVRQMEQRSSTVRGTSLYVWTIVPPVWLTTRRRDHRIFQDSTVPEIVNAVVSHPTYRGRLPPPQALLGPHPRHEYIVQYAETDWDFLCRILADAGIASFFDHANASAWTLIDDTVSLAPRVDGAVRFVDPSNMNTIDPRVHATPHVFAAAITSRVETSAVTYRGYDFERPDFMVQSFVRAADEAVHTNEASLEAYMFDVRHPGDASRGVARTQLALDAGRAARRRVLCGASFSLPPGTRMTLAEHPRDDLNVDFLVVRGHTVVDSEHGSAIHELELMELTSRFRPARRPKPRVAGTQTAFVVGAPGEEIDVDKYGRVLVEFRWDRRDQHVGATSRRVRVAQGWAGGDRGFVALPRVKDEVVIAYLDGDPDEPLIVGRVHNGTSATPLNLPAEKSITLWRSKSTPGGGGRNEILMDDAAGSERLELRGERDVKSHAGRDSSTFVGNDATTSITGNQASAVAGDHTSTVDGDHSAAIGGNQDASVAGSQKSSVGGDAHVTVGGDYDVKAKTIELDAAADVTITAGGTARVKAPKIELTTGGASIVLDGANVTITGDMINVNAKSCIKLSVGGSSFEMLDGDIRAESSLIRLNP